MKDPETLYVVDRKEWRNWLENYFDINAEVWLIYPKAATGKPRIIYNDAVEEALCFGWIDSTVKSYDANHTMQRFCPRRKGSTYSQANKERLKWLEKKGMIHPAIIGDVIPVIQEVFVFPADILDQIRQDESAWKNYQILPEPYKRIRIAFIDAARKRPDEFQKRLSNFIRKTCENKLIRGFGGIEKYYQ